MRLIEPLREALRDAISAGVLNPWCGLCKARSETFRYETARTPYGTLEEAEPYLRRAERDQLAAAALFGDMPRSDG
jgi:hypothetical protein